MVDITMNGEDITVEDGKTVLHAARDNDIYIPTLCNHSELSPYGGCRLCLVKIEGFRNYVPACTTPVSDGMVISTSEEGLNDLRKGILELILSEHPSSCIVCDERDECLELHGESTKAGRITGCRFCPNRRSCDLFDVVEKIEFNDFRIPVEYKELPLHRADPFVQRDMSICILCGRCVRVCEEIRGVGAIATVHRSHDTTIGTAFDQPLTDSGCVFCGACLDVCPTGAISSKTTRWAGVPDETVTSNCGMCSNGCRAVMQFKWGKFTNVEPVQDGDNWGQVCLRGRFASVTTVNSPMRLEYPKVRTGDIQQPVNWEKALDAVVEGLKAYSPDEIGVVASPFMTSEDAFLLQKVFRSIGCENIATASKMIGPLQMAWRGQVDRITSIGTRDDIDDADAILIVGSDLSLDNPVLQTRVHKAAEKGARTFIVTEHPHNAYRGADVLEEPCPTGLMEDVIAALDSAGSCEGCSGDGDHEGGWAGTIAHTLMAAERPVIMLGQEPFAVEEDGVAVSSLILKLFKAVSGKALLILWDGPNVQGLMGSACVPGIGLDGELLKEAGPNKPPLGDGIKALLLTEPVSDIPDGVEFVAYMGPYPFDGIERADVILPTCTYADSVGTIVAMDRLVGSIETRARPPTMAKRDFQVLMDLGGRLGAEGLSNIEDPYDISTSTFVDYHIGKHIKEMDVSADCGPVDPSSPVNPAGKWISGPLRYRGLDITEASEDLGAVVRKWGWTE